MRDNRIKTRNLLLVGNVAAFTCITHSSHSLCASSPVSLAVILQTGFLHFVIAVVYLLFSCLCCLNNFLFACVPMFITLRACASVSLLRLFLLVIACK